MVSLAALYPSPRGTNPAREPELSTSGARGAVLVFAVMSWRGSFRWPWGTGSTARPRCCGWRWSWSPGHPRPSSPPTTRPCAAASNGGSQEQTADLHRFARQNEVLLNSVGDGIYGVDRDGLITFVNPRAAEALGLPWTRCSASTPTDFHGEHAPPANGRAASAT